MNGNLTPPSERDFPERQLQLRKEQLLSTIHTGRARQTVRPWMRRRRTLVIAFAAVTAAAVAATVLPATGGGPGSASAAVLDRLAARIAAQSWTPGPGQYLYIDTESEWGAYSGGCQTRSVERNQIWAAPDGSGLIRVTKEAGHFDPPSDRERCMSMPNARATFHHDLVAWTSDEWNAPNCLGYGQDVDWSGYSSDPQTLLQQIDEQWHNPDATPADQFDEIEQTLGQSNPPPDVIANIYRAAALIPGVRSLGTVQDHAGRSGIGLSLEMPHGTSEMIFDADTGRLLGQTDTGRLSGWYVYLQKKIVDQLPSDPPVPLTPPCTVTGGGRTHDIPGGLVSTGP